MNKSVEYECPCCDGASFVFIDNDLEYIQLCPLCKGKRKVDWITKAMGYNEKHKQKSKWFPQINKVKGVISNDKN
jgi:hypothetical protein